MNKKIIILLLVLILVVIAVLGIFFYYQITKMPKVAAPINSLNLHLINVNSSTNANLNLNVPAVNTPAIPNTPVINTNTSVPDYQPVSISINNFAFNPKQRNVKIGTTVTWTNDDPMPHQIVGSIFGSQPLNTGDSYSFTFTQAGNYDYHCAIHPTMTGQIIVTQ